MNHLLSKKKTWRYTLFGCKTDCNFCLTAVFCPCVAIGKNYALRRGRESKTNTYENQPCWLTGLCCCFGGCLYFIPCYAVMEHRKNTETLNIVPSETSEPSGFVLGCCYPCTLTLDHQELMDWNFAYQTRPQNQVMEDGGGYAGSHNEFNYKNNSSSNYNNRKKMISSPTGEVAVHWHGGAQK